MMSVYSLVMGEKGGGEQSGLRKPSSFLGKSDRTEVVLFLVGV